MTATSGTGSPGADRGPRRSLHDLLGRSLRGASSQHVGRLHDVIVRLDTTAYPAVTGIVADIAGQQLYVPADRIAGWLDPTLALLSNQVDLRPFARRDGEVLLAADIRGHRLIDIPAASLVKAWDVELTVPADGPPRLVGVDIRPRALWRRALAALRPGHAAPVTDDSPTGTRCRDWSAFEALIGHTPSILARSPIERLRTLKAPQIADLLEEASQAEQAELLDQVHADPELEADVFEELDDNDQSRLLRGRTDDDVAGVLARMRADDAADAISDLPQQRRRRVLDLLPPAQRTKVTMLLGYNPTSAGGLMTLDHLALPASTTVAAALDRVRATTTSQPEALVTVFALDERGRLTGSIGLVGLLQSTPEATLAAVAEPDPVRVRPEADVVEIAVTMTDYNLLDLPVVDDDGRVLGVITVDDALEVTVPDNWRRRDTGTTPDTSTEHVGSPGTT